MKQFFCLGSYTEPILFGTGEVFHGKGQGICICSFEDGIISEISKLKVRNPSFICINEKMQRIYAVNELKEYLGEFGGGITEVKYNANGEMSILSTKNTGGSDPCHVAMSPDGRLLCVANFASGSLTTFGLNVNGFIDTDRHLYQHKGHSIDTNRQKGPHAHSTVYSPSGEYIYVPDLGIDKIKVYKRGDKTDGEICDCPEKDVSVQPGNGPRFAEFHPNGRDFYLINEIASTVEHYVYKDGNLTFQSGISTLPSGYPKEDNICSDIHITPDGKFLYASNRGNDSIAVFSFLADGNLNLEQIVSCGGKTPRNFAIDPTGKYLLVGNQDNDNIVSFKIKEKGRLEKISSYKFGSPVCLQFFKTTIFSVC